MPNLQTNYCLKLDFQKEVDQQAVAPFTNMV